MAVVERPPLRRAARVRGQYRQFPLEASAAGGERDNSRGWMPNEEYAGLPGGTWTRRTIRRAGIGISCPIDDEECVPPPGRTFALPSISRAE